MHLYGPFSPDLKQETLSLSLGGIIRTERDPGGYGERYSVPAEYVRQARESGRIDGIALRGFEQLAHWLAPKRVRELEAISTAEYIAQHRPGASDDEIVERVESLKPHLRREEVIQALRELRRYRTLIKGAARTP
ncbi:MAG: hypothetical protein OXC71_03495 [Chloroflexi bacterium]|nr:hypothetical protein [Chloroflexota bacterium]